LSLFFNTFCLIFYTDIVFESPKENFGSLDRIEYRNLVRETEKARAESRRMQTEAEDRRMKAEAENRRMKDEAE